MDTRVGERWPAGAPVPLGLLVVGLVEVWTSVRLGGIGTAAATPRLALSVTVTVVTLALWERRRHPVAVAGVICAVLAVQVLAIAPQVSLLAGLLPMLIAVYTAAAYGPRPWRVAALVGALAVQGTFAIRIPEERLTGEVLFGLFVIVGTWLVGDIVHTRQRRVEDVAKELVRVEAERDARMALALADERASIARELHDVIAHGVSVMGVQAAGAHVLVDRDPGAAKTALQQIEAQARESVEELQRLLGVLREPADAGTLEPQPGLRQVPTLVEQMRHAGVPIELCVEGTVRSLPAGVDLAAYRVVQEALTNVLKHAGSVPARVQVRYERAAVAVDVRDQGPPRQPGRPGHGLIGMRERIALYGGALDINQPSDGGFQVVARFPLEQAPA
ncbi:MAG: sensor histidine kinase [Nocardioidaceae bacterium]